MSVTLQSMYCYGVLPVLKDPSICYIGSHKHRTGLNKNKFSIFFYQ